MAKTIAVAGKGGTGKTTVAALIVRHLKEKGAGPILALDADPDSNLGTVLGIPIEKTIGELREETLKAMKDFPPGMSKEAYIEAGLHEVVVETESVDLITMGRSEGPGCYCYMNNLLRKFADELNDAYKWVVMDNEAGLEHVSRRTASRIDYLIAVVSENPLSLDCARRVDELVDELKNPIGKKYVIANAIRDDRVETISRKVEDLGLGMEYLGHIPRDEVLDDAIFNGESVYGINGSVAFARLGEALQRIGVE